MLKKTICQEAVRISANAGGNDMFEPVRQAELDESRGQLLQVQEAEGQCIAIFAWGAVSLPGELADRLREFVGHKIGILRLDGWHIRDL